MNIDFKKQIKIVLSLVVLFAMVFSSFPHFSNAEGPGCIANFTTKPMVTGGASHTVALKSDGTVWAWGNNYSGQLGDGTNDTHISPVQVSALCDVIAIAAGESHNLALKKDGTVWAWGANLNWQLGRDNSALPNTMSKIPLQVPNLSGVVAIAAGSGHSVALKNDGTVWGWGACAAGQLGFELGNSQVSSLPKQVSTLTNVKAIAAGSYHTAALANDGTVWTWGTNGYGALGYDVTGSGIQYTPHMVPNLTNADAIATGYYFTVVLKSDGTVWSWGLNNFGQLGNGTTTTSQNQVQVLSSLNPKQELNGVESITAKGSHAIALLKDGTLRTWGFNGEGAIGDGTFLSSNVATKPILTGGFITAGTGVGHSIAVSNDGSIWTWGSNINYQLGYELPPPPPNYFSNVPRKVEGLRLFIAAHPILVLRGQTTLTYAEWSTAATNLTAQLYNPGIGLAHVRLELIPDSGVTLVDGDAIHVLDSLPAEATVQTEWQLKVTKDGIHNIKVNAYREGDLTPFDQAEHSIEAIAPVVPPNVALAGISGYQSNGTPTATRSATLTIQATFDDPCTTEVTLTATDANGHVYTGQVSPIPGAAWSHIFNPSQSGLTDSPLTIKINPDCGPIMQFDILLIDPSGIVYNAEQGDEQEWPLPGATVVLQYNDPVAGWVNMSEDDYPGRMSPITNPQTTGEDGRYAWDTMEGQYRVSVSRPGFQSAISRVVDVGPPVTDLHVGLTPTDRNPPSLTVTGVTNGATYAQPITVQFSASDDESGVRQVTYQLDDGHLISVNGNGGSFRVTDQGLHTVDFTVVDHAGNKLIRELSFRIEEPSEGVPSSNADLSGLTLSSGTLSPAFAPDTTIYKARVANDISSVTVTALADDSTYASVSASVYNNAGMLVSGPLILTSDAASPALPLSVGSNEIKLVVTAQDGTTKTYTVTVTRESESIDGGTTAPSGAVGNPSSDMAWFRIVVDGKEFNQIATADTSQEGGTTVLAVKLDTAKLVELLAKTAQRPVILIPVAASADKITVALTGDAVKALANKQAVIELQTPNGSYTLPASEIGVDTLSKQLGDPAKLSDILVRVSISKGDSAIVKLLANTAARERFTVVVPPIDFSITASYNGRTANTGKFSSYVKREIPLPNGADPGKMTTAVTLEADGTTRHVPTYISSRDGKYFAVFHSLTNSAYVLIQRSVVFVDVNGHWAQQAVNDLAYRKIVSGVDETHYRPDAAITRAEFAAIVVRALGLADNGQTSSFTDVKNGDWYIGAVAKAQEYGIVEGYKDGTFRAAKTITRQEAIEMIVRGMKLAGLDTSISAADVDAVLSGFSDGATVAAWARQAVAAAVKSGLVSGSGLRLKPANNITRAETAVIVQRLLKQAKLI